MEGHQRVKIVATIGPASNNYDVLKSAVKSGLDVARLNFSHGTHSDHKKVIDLVRKISKEEGHPITLLQDLQGPKIRVGSLKDGEMLLKDGDEITITNQDVEGENLLIPVDFFGLPGAVKVGDKVLFDDGLIEAQIISTSSEQVKCKVLFGGVLKNRKGVNVPGADLPIDCMTPKDIEDLEFGLNNNVDYVALSFVRRGQDIKNLKQIIEQKNPRVKVIAKIEMLEAIENLEEIIALSDGVMVARGDLAVEVGQTRLPGLQKKIINLANKYGKPVITATQMLDSMVINPRPTRAEITDVANAVLDGTDALMLSAESASGRFPVECISTMSEISVEAEKSSDFYDINLDKEVLSVAESIGMSACLTALKLNASAIVCLTTSGKTAQIISSYRPKAKIIAVTHLEATLSKLQLVWGIQPIAIKPYKSTDEAMSQIEKILLKEGLVKSKDKVILTLGVPVIQRAKTNSLRVFEIN